MDVADAAGDNLFATVGVFVVATTLALISAAGVAVWLVLALLGGAVAETFGTLLPIFAVAGLISAPLAAAALVAVGYGLVVRTSAVIGATFQDQVDGAARWVGRTARRFERRSALARVLDLSPVVESLDSRTPEERAQDRIERLKAGYVADHLSEFELERRIRRVLVDEDVSRDQVTTLDVELADARRREVER